MVLHATKQHAFTSLRACLAVMRAHVLSIARSCTRAHTHSILTQEAVSLLSTGYTAGVRRGCLSLSWPEAIELKAKRTSSEHRAWLAGPKK